MPVISSALWPGLISRLLFRKNVVWDCDYQNTTHRGSSALEQNVIWRGVETTIDNRVVTTLLSMRLPSNLHYLYTKFHTGVDVHVFALAGILYDYMRYPKSLLGGPDPCKDLDSSLDHFKL